MATPQTPRHSTRVTAQKLDSIDQEPISTLHRIPIEIRLKILEEILVSPDRLSFTRTWRPPSKRSQASYIDYNTVTWYEDISPVLRLCCWHKTEDNEPIARALHSEFVNLCLVSKQMRGEAMKIFFGSNSWVLHVAEEMNSIDWMVEKWGEGSVRAIKNLRIEIQSVGYLDDWLVYIGLERFVDVVREGAQLRSLSVHFRHAWMPVPTPRYEGYIPHLISLGRPSQRARKVERTDMVGLSLGEGSGSNNNNDDDDDERRPNESGYAIWPAKDMILMPLHVLRGLNAIVEGDVTEEWALWLEDYMKANEGEEKTEFVGDARASETAQILKRASSGEEYWQMLAESVTGLTGR